MNMHLESISIELDDDCLHIVDYELDDFPIISDLPNLKTLNISIGDHVKIHNALQRMIHFKNLNHLRIQSECYSDISGLSVSVDNLHSLEMDCDADIENMLKFITHNKSVELLKYEGDFMGNKLKIIEAFASLPKLRELNILSNRGVIYSDVIIELLKSCRSLSKLSIRNKWHDISNSVLHTKYDISKYPDVKDQWTVTTEMRSCILHKVLPKA